MKRTKSFTSGIGPELISTTKCSIDAAEQRHDVATTPATEPSPHMTNSMGARRPASPVRLTLACRLGDKIDGAWWPRSGLISRELTELVSLLEVRLGQVVDINVNWSSLQRQHDLNCWWQGLRPDVMTVDGRDARAKLLIVPHRTGTALAVMVLRRAAGLPVFAAHRDLRAFQTADCIVRMARGEPMFDVRRSRRAEVAATLQGPQN